MLELSPQVFSPVPLTTALAELGAAGTTLQMYAQALAQQPVVSMASVPSLATDLGRARDVARGCLGVVMPQGLRLDAVTIAFLNQWMAMYPQLLQLAQVVDQGGSAGRQAALELSQGLDLLAQNLAGHRRRVRGRGAPALHRDDRGVGRPGGGCRRGGGGRGDRQPGGADQLDAGGHRPGLPDHREGAVRHGQGVGPAGHQDAQLRGLPPGRGEGLRGHHREHGEHQRFHHRGAERCGAANPDADHALLGVEPAARGGGGGADGLAGSRADGPEHHPHAAGGERRGARLGGLEPGLQFPLEGAPAGQPPAAARARPERKQGGWQFLLDDCTGWQKVGLFPVVLLQPTTGVAA
ncbi:hypothetical protein D7V93_00450 [Corallococcus llansteffanensis]|uniref:Uncharacterized protein n=1 Tax=Corallococcus llansteffanensis TaxID=2316731 RepID=A0A3A8QRL6_9BACT|nr:hypothetical protein D7V93_00450 [Corallococcus llansteffanensis]